MRFHVHGGGVQIQSKSNPSDSSGRGLTVTARFVHGAGGRRKNVHSGVQMRENGTRRPKGLRVLGPEKILKDHLFFVPHLQ